MCVIVDDSGVFGLGGVMGGEIIGFMDEIIEVFIEFVYFDLLCMVCIGCMIGIILDVCY